MLMIPAMETSSPDHLVSQPIVSVLLMTRNHAQYIKEAISSILMQRTDFPFEIIIGEDYSSDETLKICMELQTDNPDRIRVITATENVGITPNFLRLVARARGKYCALLEGDDYWTTEDKLAIQVARMEDNYDWVWCGSRTKNRAWCVPIKSTYDLHDHVRRYVFHTSSVMFRTGALRRYPRFPDMVGWISMAYIYLAQQGISGFINSTLSYYRHHPGGLWWGKSRSDQFEFTTRFTKVMDSHLGQQYHSELTAREFWIFQSLLQKNIAISILSQTTDNISLFCNWFPHLWRQSKTRTAQLILLLVSLPATTAAQKLFRVLAIRTRIRKTLDGLRN